MSKKKAEQLSILIFPVIHSKMFQMIMFINSSFSMEQGQASKLMNWKRTSLLNIYVDATHRS